MAPPSPKSPSKTARSPSAVPSSPSTSTSNLDIPPLNPISEEIATAPTEKRISFYVQAAEDMLEAVLGPLEQEDADEAMPEGFQGREAHLFSVEERKALDRWRNADYQTKYLFIRLYLRKARWIRLDSLDGKKGYEIGRDIEDLKSAAEDLWRLIPIESSPSPPKDPKGKGKMKEEDVEMLTINSSPPQDPQDSKLFSIPKFDPLPPVPSSSSPKETSDAPPPKKRKIDLDLTADTDSDDDCLIVENPTPGPSRAKVKAPSTPPPMSRTNSNEICYDRLAFSAKELEHEEPDMILGLLTMDELTGLAKKMNCIMKGPKTRTTLTTALLKTSSQTTLSFSTPILTKKKGSTSKSKKSSPPLLGMSYDEKGRRLTQSGIVKQEAINIIGPIILIHPSYRTLFDRLSLIYHRTPSLPSKVTRPNSASAFTTSLLARFGKRTYPTYDVKRSFEIFKSREELMDYELALGLNRDMEECLEGVYFTSLGGGSGSATMLREDSGSGTGSAGSPGRGKPKEKTKEEKEALRDMNWKEGIRLFETVADRWSEYCVKEELKDEPVKEEEEDKKGKGKEKCVDESKGMLYYRMRFHPGWPLTRLMYKASAIFGRMHEHDKEIKILRDLLAQKTFRRGKRGAWYDRLALLLMHYATKEEEKAKEKGKENKAEKMRVSRLENAKKVCEDALADPFTHLIYQSSLQRRIARIESALKVPEDERTTFDHVLTKARERVMEGERLDEAIVGKKSVWRANDGSEVSVEELVLEQYVKEGWKGFHSENGVLTSIFALVFWDIIFAPVDGVFETAFQSAPLDLATDAFAIVRRPLIDARLKQIKKGKASKFLTLVDDRERPLNTFCVGINWEKYSKEDLLEIVDCIGGPALAKILRMFVEEYGHRTGGIPDLCLWNPATRSCMFSEVKGPGDHLSETQKVWLDVLLNAGVEVEICKVWTSEEKEKFEKQKAEKEKNKGKGGKKRKRVKDDDSEEEDE